MLKFNIIQPSIMLAPYVKHYWLLECDDVINTQRVIPSGNVELIFHRGSLMKSNGLYIPVVSLSGQNISFSDLTPTGKVNMIAVVFHPFGAKAFFKFSIKELADLKISGNDINITTLKELEDKILNAHSNEDCIHFIENFLISRLSPFKEYNYKRMVTAINMINYSKNYLSVLKLAETCCLSTKQFQRVFTDHVGATPKEFMRIIRFQYLCIVNFDTKYKK